MSRQKRRRKHLERRSYPQAIAGMIRILRDLRDQSIKELSPTIRVLCICSEDLSAEHKDWANRQLEILMPEPGAGVSIEPHCAHFEYDLTPALALRPSFIAIVTRLEIEADLVALADFHKGLVETKPEDYHPTIYFLALTSESTGEPSDEDASTTFDDSASTSMSSKRTRVLLN